MKLRRKPQKNKSLPTKQPIWNLLSSTLSVKSRLVLKLSMDGKNKAPPSKSLSSLYAQLLDTSSNVKVHKEHEPRR